MPEYEIRIETPVFIPPKLVAQGLKKLLKRILEQYGQYTIEAKVDIVGEEKKEEERMEEAEAEA